MAGQSWLRTMALVLGVGLAGSGAAQAPAPANSAQAATPGAAAQTGATPGNASSPAPATGAPASPSTTQATAAPRNLAGTIDLVDGSSHVVAPDQSSRVPKVGDKLYEGDSVVTDANAEMHIQMADGGFIAVRPNSALQVSKYQANGDASDRSVISLVHGTLRSITGWIGKTFPRNYAIRTPDATIGVRGTDHETAYLTEASGDTEAGTYDTVHAGGTTLTTAQGHVDVSPDHAGFVGRGGRGGPPRMMQSVPHFFAAPHRNDARMIGMHDRIAANFAQRRAARMQEHAQELRNFNRGGFQRPGMPGASGGGLPGRAQAPGGGLFRQPQTPGQPGPLQQFLNRAHPATPANPAAPAAHPVTPVRRPNEREQRRYHR